MFVIKVQAETFDPGQEISRLRDVSPEIGGITCFIGLVRDINDDDQVSSLFLEHYPGMTEKQIEAILEEAARRWHVIGATVIHRIGLLHPGDEIVLVAVASRHRADAFDASEFIIDYLKTRATFWKKEQTAVGQRWLTTRQTDVEAAAEWEDSDR